MKVVEIALDQIEQNENSRVQYKEQDLAELMGSMRQDGLLQPIGVRPIGKNRYEAIWGNRRLIAARKLGWGQIAASVQELEDDVQRDIINLVENFKREQTSAIEDGRMFLLLKDRGLTNSEIAARLGISMNRVETAIDLFHGIPKEHRARVVNRMGGGPMKKGKIGARSAHKVILLKKRYSLSKKDTNSLLDYVSQDLATDDHLAQMAPLLKNGIPVSEAIQKIGILKPVILRVLIDAKRIKKLETKYGKPITDILLDHLCDHPEFKIVRRKHRGRKTRLPEVEAARASA